MNKLISAIAVLAALSTSPAFAEVTVQEPVRKFQVTPYVGAFIPTGDQRDVLDDAFLSGITLSYDIHRYVAAVGSFGWAASQGQQGPATGEDLDLFTYDLGVQGHYPLALGKEFTLKPFVGAGLGARTYSYRDVDNSDAETDFVGYFSAGANLEYRQFALGLTLRDYISDFDGVDTNDDSSTRNDLAAFASVGMRF